MEMGGEARMHRDPVGVALLITPWNASLPILPTNCRRHLPLVHDAVTKRPQPGGSGLSRSLESTLEKWLRRPSSY
jgi:hypothetical protein